nr:TIGR01212 family radical SAM protein [Lachnospiraceae bacterium]
MIYTSVSDYLKEKYHTKVYKLSLSTGCTCPNRDGTIGFGGCIFCSEGGSGDFAAKVAPIKEQMAEARQKVEAKIPSRIPLEERNYIAYFQSFTNTYGDEDRLIALFQEVLSYPEIAGISIGTRPDCLSDKMI